MSPARGAGLQDMGRVTCQISVSLDGFAAGPDQSLENPIGRGGMRLHEVTDGIDPALEQARAAAGGRDVAIAGGASTVQQFLAAGHLDELHLHIVPIVLGAGERLLQDVGDPVLEPVEVVASPAATHVRYRVVR
jgi:dihydrofolate reductase